MKSPNKLAVVNHLSQEMHYEYLKIREFFSNPRA
jgi:hypothetical protein